MAKPPWSVLAVALVAAGIAGILVASTIASQPSPCCYGKRPYVSLYARPLSRVDAVLAEGDGQAFAAVAQDPLLRRPGVMAPGEYSYRAQRPVWAYLAWAGSLGQPGSVGWALVALTILSAGAAAGVVALLLRRRNRSSWWALATCLFAFDTLRELTPELLALAAFGAGLLLWQDQRTMTAVAFFTVSALTRESLLVGVAGLAAWELLLTAPSRGPARRRVSALLVPFAAFASWYLIVGLRVGQLFTTHSDGRLALPGAGFLSSLGRSSDPAAAVIWLVAAAALCVALTIIARRDALTWVAVAYLGLASVLGEAVWRGDSGYTRALMPLYVLGSVALLGGLRARSNNRRLEGLTRRSSPPLTSDASAEPVGSDRALAPSGIVE